MGQENRILKSIKAAESLLNTAITIHDRSGIFRGRGGEYLLNRTRGIHRHPCCRLIHDHRCLAECRDRIDAECEIRDRVFSHVCWKGIKEVVVPVKRDGGLLFNLFAGGYRAGEKADGLPDRRLGKTWKRLYDALPVMDEEREMELGLLVESLAGGLVQITEDMAVPAVGEAGRKGEIRRFIHYHAHRKVTMGNLADHLHLSRFRTSHLVTEIFGTSFRSLLLKERLERGKALLLSRSDRTVADIAGLVGMGDEYHFNREFKKVYGQPPGRYRKKHAAV